MSKSNPISKKPQNNSKRRENNFRFGASDKKRKFQKE